LGEKVEQVDRTNQPQSQQAFQSDRPDNCEVDRPEETEPETEAEAEEAYLIGFIRYAIAENDSQFAKEIQVILRDVCSAGAADRQKVWASLTEAEKSAFTALLSTPESTPATSEPEPTPTPEPTSEPASEPTPVPAPATPTSKSTAESAIESAATPRAEQVSEEDAEKLRDIALIWWPEYYPEQIQGLITQMYGWKAPANKYETAVIFLWLEGEDAEVRERINQLISLKNNSSQLTTDEGTETDYDK
jgi:pyruvate/2-oxoglutarate dehydrogenase complex dihydrolipoamide acyltransferase (E2) component